MKLVCQPGFEVHLHSAQHWRAATSMCVVFIIKKYERVATTMLDIKFEGLLSVPKNKRQRVFLTPVPGLATQCIKANRSPAIDWERLATESTNGMIA